MSETGGQTIRQIVESGNKDWETFKNETQGKDEQKTTIVETGVNDVEAPNDSTFDDLKKWHNRKLRNFYAGLAVTLGTISTVVGLQQETGIPGDIANNTIKKAEDLKQIVETRIQKRTVENIAQEKTGMSLEELLVTFQRGREGDDEFEAMMEIADKIGNETLFIESDFNINTEAVPEAKAGLTAVTKKVIRDFLLNSGLSNKYFSPDDK